MNRLIRSVLTLTALVPCLAFSQIRGTVLNDLMDRSNVSAWDAAAAIVIADAVGLDPMALIREVRPYGVTVYETAPAWVIVHECHKPFDVVYREHRRGKGWGQIAHDMGMHPGTYNKLRKSGAFDRGCWVEMTRPWNVDEREWRRYSDRGLSGREIVLATAIGRGDRNRTESAVSSRMKHGYWDVPGGKRVHPSKPVKSAGHGKSIKSSGSVRNNPSPSGRSASHGRSAKSRGGPAMKQGGRSMGQKGAGSQAGKGHGGGHDKSKGNGKGKGGKKH